MPDHMSFRWWLSGAAAGASDGDKALCLMHYFTRIRQDAQKMASGGARDGEEAPTTDRIQFTRLVLPGTAPDAADWMACSAPLLPLVVEQSTSLGIEDAKGAIQADFANEFIGGGVMTGGSLQVLVGNRIFMAQIKFFDILTKNNSAIRR